MTLCISEQRRKAGYTPEHNYDPRYYDFCDTGYEAEVMKHLEERFGNSAYAILCDGVVFTIDYDVAKFMQDAEEFHPMWFDICSHDIPTAEELKSQGYTW